MKQKKKKRKIKKRKVKKKIQKKDKKLRLKQVALVFLIIVIVLAVVSIILSFRIRQIRIIEMKLKVRDHIGFNVESESINFGMAIPGSTATRSLELNSGNETYRGVIFLIGNLAKWVEVSEKNFVFQGEKSIGFNAKPPNDAQIGNYTGKAIIILIR